MALNKIINKYMITGTLVIGSTAACLIGGTIYANTGNESDKEAHTTNGNTVVLLSTIILLMSVCPILDTYYKANRFASNVAKKYIKSVMHKHPELKDFENVLNNKKAVHSIATMISNRIIPSEKRAIEEIIHKAQNINQKSETQKMIAFINARDQIVEILKQHNTIDQNFILEIYAAMAYADMKYIVPNNQKIRS